MLLDADPPPKLFTRQFYLLCLSSVLFMASFNMIIPELPAFLTALGGEQYLGLNIFLFTLMALASRPFSGRLVDSIGRVPVMIFGALMSSACGLFYPFVGSLFAYFALRTVHGMSTGFKPTGTTAYLADVVPAQRRGEALGYLGMSGSMGMAAGPAVGGWVAKVWSQEAMFFLSSGVALLSVVVLLGMSETLKNRQRFRLGLLRVPLNEIVEPRLLGIASIMFLICIPFGAVLTITPDLSDHLGITNRGAFMTVFVVCSFVVRFLAGRASDRLGRKVVLQVGIITLIAAMILLSLATNKWLFFGSAAIYGIAVGINAPTIFAWTVDLSLEAKRGLAMATLYIGLELGIGLGALISAWVYGNDPSQFAVTFLICAISGALGLIYLLRIRSIPGYWGLPEEEAAQ